jgi:copper chaperone
MMTSATYQVTGMTCEHCARAVTGELAGLNGVSGVTVDLVPGGVSAVTVTSGSPLTAEAVAAALDEAGDYRLAAAADADGPHAAPSARALPVL